MSFLTQIFSSSRINLLPTVYHTHTTVFDKLEFFKLYETFLTSRYKKSYLKHNFQTLSLLNKIIHSKMRQTEKVH